MVDKVKQMLSPILSVRFLQYCSVGFSGVGVNLLFLFIFADVMKMHVNVASALSIELSILSNFAINEFWTFKDKRNGDVSFLMRGFKFNVVSLLGASMQWAIFVVFNVIWLILLYSDQDVLNYHALLNGWFEKWVVHPVVDPPDVGYMKYISQLAGISVATFWNFLMNYYWTWGEDKGVTNE